MTETAIKKPGACGADCERSAAEHEIIEEIVKLGERFASGDALTQRRHENVLELLTTLAAKVDERMTDLAQRITKAQRAIESQQRHIEELQLAIDRRTKSATAPALAAPAEPKLLNSFEVAALLGFPKNDPGRRAVAALVLTKALKPSAGIVNGRGGKQRGFRREDVEDFAKRAGIKIQN